jgi:hypothetical protein
VQVITAQNAFLSARETELQVQLRQLTASVSLINDLGGGWSMADLGQTEATAKHPPDPDKEPLVPVENSGARVANPPALPPGEAPPDDFMKRIDDAIAPSPGNSGTEK